MTRLLFLCSIVGFTAGCVRPVYDQMSGEANILAADQFDASVADLVRDNMALRQKIQDAAFAIVKNRADEAHRLALSATTRPADLATLATQTASVRAGIDSIQAQVATEQQERGVITEIGRKAGVASGVVRTLGMRSKAIAIKEKELLGSLGVQQ